ncbi:MAG: hypothetical protein E7360_00170 [Clostridiales bacterium]|nr:hypothetical protein [Clostridiales bacterium]
MKKRFVKLLAVLLTACTLICCSFVVTGCSSSDECKITYQLALPSGINGSIKSTNQTVTYGKKYSLYVPSCSSSNYEFEGWQIKGTKTMVPLNGNQWGYKKNVTLVAVWGVYTGNY